MTYQFMAALVESLGGEVRQVRIDRMVAGAYAATLEVDGPLGARLVDARPSDALNLAVLVGAAVFVVPEVLADIVGHAARTTGGFTDRNGSSRSLLCDLR
jgi:bifunctional DNase/RNase